MVLLVDVWSMVLDVVLILMLVIVVVVVVMGVIGFVVVVVMLFGIVMCLLFGVMIVMMDFFVVIVVFCDVGVLVWLICLVEGEVLFNDVVVIVIMGVLFVMFMGYGGDVFVGIGLCELVKVFGGGVVFGLIVGCIVVFLLFVLCGIV